MVIQVIQNNLGVPGERESIAVLRECIDLQIRKSHDYQNPLSSVKQADHYPHGINTITDMVHQKMVRARSLLEAAEHSDSKQPNFESIDDTFKDAINYLSFAVSWMRGKMEGQRGDRDVFNRPIRSAFMPDYAYETEKKESEK